MYKCSECGSEYEIKPDFCDCGNDVFEEIIPQERVIYTPQGRVRKETNSANIFAWLCFFICVVVSVLILLFFPKINPDTAKPQKDTTVKTVTKPAKDIPSLNSFWIESTPEPQPESDANTHVEQIKNTFTKLTQNNPPQATPQKPKQVAQPKPATQAKQTTQTKPVKKEVKQTSTQQKTQAVKKTEQKPATQTATKPKTTSQTQTKSTPNYEMLAYKERLRNRLFSNLSFSAIQGEGTCGVEFSIDSSGKLINRKFTFQSDNKSVNDEVYKMLMRTPSFSPPPESYKGEKFKLILKLSQDSYEIKMQ